MITTKFVQIFLIRSVMDPFLSLLGSICRVGFSLGYPIQRKNPDLWDIPRVKNPDSRGFCINTGDKKAETRKIPNPGDKNPDTRKKSRIPGIFQKSRKIPDGQRTVKTHKNFKVFQISV